MTTNDFSSVLSLNGDKEDKNLFDQILNHETVKTNDFLKELTDGGFDKDIFSEALLSYSEYDTNIFEKPKIFTKSFINYEIKFTNHVSIKNNNELIIKNLRLIKENIVDMLSGLTIIQKDIKNDKRLKAICKEYKWNLEEEVDLDNYNLFKFEGKPGKDNNNNYSNSFRVYAGIVGTTLQPKKIRLLFIDPYHLAIPSEHRYAKNSRPVSREQVKNNTFSQCQYYREHIYQLIEDKLYID